MNRRAFLGALALAAGSPAASSQTQAPAAPTASALPLGLPTLRVLTYNVHHGEGTDRRLDLDRIAGVIRAAEPDLVALQEVDRVARRTGDVDQAAVYARLTGLHGWFGAAMPFQGGDYGQVLLSRWPLLQPRVLRLPGTPGREPRIAVCARVEIPRFQPLLWSGVHLDASRTDEDRLQQVETLLRDLNPDRLPALLAGDFNDVPDSRVMRRMLADSESWLDTAHAAPDPTSPAEAPRSRIDYILAFPLPRWRVRESRVLAEAVASDHRPLLAVLEPAG